MVSRRVPFSCWRSASRKKNSRIIVFAALATLCILGYLSQIRPTRLKLQNVSLLLSGPILPVPTMKSTLNITSLSESSLLSDIEFLLKIRKLNVFAVHEMNKIVGSSDFYSFQCVKWWSNPLTVLSVDNISETGEYWDQRLSYMVHPGNFHFDVQIRQRKPPIGLTHNDLEIISPFKCASSLPNQYCLGKDASDELKSVCQCGNSEDDSLVVLESETLKERIKWNSTDPELITWRLHKSFSVQDYLNFTNYDTYISSPGRRNETLRAKYCQPSINLLIMISSAPTHFLQRKAIRNTYGNPENLPEGVRLVFLMGNLAGNDFQEDLKKEMDTYDDIIVETFVDSYHNLTLSHLSMYKWIYLTCSQISMEMPTHVLKADDDFFINVDLALRLVQENPKVEYMGVLYCGTKPIRDAANYMPKYYTPRYMYASNVYVGYLSGVTYILKTDIIPRVLHVALTTPIIHMDDAYMTGLIPRQMKIYPRNSPLITYTRIDPDPCLLRKSVCSCVINVEDMLLQWNKFKEPLPSNCSLDYIDFHLQKLDEKQTTDCYFM